MQTTVDCFQQFKSEHNQHNDPLVVLLCSFVGAQWSTTAKYWFKRDTMPEGTYLLRLRCFLELLGYNVTELSSLTEPVRTMARIVGYQVLSAQDATTLLGYAKQTNLFNLIIRGQGAVSDRLTQIGEIVDAHQNELTAADQQWKSRLTKARQKPAPPELPPPVRTTTSVPAAPPARDLTKQHILAGLASHLMGARPLAELVASDAYSDADREELRRLCGGEEAYFELTNTLFRLSGRTARKLYTS